MIYYYSGCGNSRWVAEELAAGLGENIAFIPELQRAGVGEIDVEGQSVGFVFPIYAWAPPQLVEDFVLSVKWTGKPAYVWFACTCGDEMGMTRKVFAETLSKAGMSLDAAYCFQMPETYLAFPGFKLDTEEGARAKIVAAKAKMPSVVAHILGREQLDDLIVGSMPRLKTYLIRPGFVKNVSDSKYHVEEGCISCGKCAQVCPLNNIRLVDGKPQWQGGCTQCMACYQHCPTNAIQCATYTKGKGQYYFKDSYLK